MNRQSLATRHRRTESDPPPPFKCMACRAIGRSYEDSPFPPSYTGPSGDESVFITLVMVVTQGLESVVQTMCDPHRARYMQGLTRALEALAEKQNRERDAKLRVELGELLEPLIAIADADDAGDLSPDDKLPNGDLIEAQLRDGTWETILTMEDCRRARRFVKGGR